MSDTPLCKHGLEACDDCDAEQEGVRFDKTPAPADPRALAERLSGDEWIGRVVVPPSQIVALARYALDRDAALHSIRFAAARGRMAKRKDEALDMVLRICGEAGATSSPFRDDPAPPRGAATGDDK